MRKLIVMAMFFWLGLIATSPALAGVNDMVTQFQTQANGLMSNMISSGVKLLSILWMINFVLDNWKLMFSGEWPQIFSKMLSSLLWVGFLLWMVKDPKGPLDMIFNGFVSLAGAGNGQMDPDRVIENGLALINNLWAAPWAKEGMEFSIAQIGKNLSIMMALLFTTVLVLIAYALMTLAIVMAKMEFYMIMIVAPVTFALGGLSALKDTAIAPLKSALSLGYRILIIGIIATLAQEAARGWADDFKNFSVTNWDPLFMPIIGMIIIVGMTFSAGKIAAALASGSAALSGNDALGGAMKAASMAGGAAAAAGLGMSMMMGGLAKGLGVSNNAGAIGKALGQALSGLRSPSASNASSQFSPGGNATGASAADQQRNQDTVNSMGGAPAVGADAGGGGASGDAGSAPSDAGSSSGGSSAGGSSGSSAGSAGSGSSGSAPAGSSGSAAPSSAAAAPGGAPAGSSSAAPAGNAMDAGVGGAAAGSGNSAPGGSGSGSPAAPGNQAQQDQQLKKEKRMKARERRDAMRKAMQAMADENNAQVSVSVNTNVHNH